MLPGRFGAVASTIRSKFVVHKHIASSEHRTGRWWSLEGQLLHTNSNSDTVSANSALLIRESPRRVTSLVLRHPFWGSALRVLNGAEESSTITRIPRQGEEVRPLEFWIHCETTRWFPIPMLSSRSMNKTSIVPKPVPTRPRRFQRGSLQKRKSAGGLNWIAFWWQDHHRRSQILGPCTEMTRPEALAEMAKLLQPINADAGKVLPRVWTLADWIRDSFLPFSRRHWKLSTASTTGDRIHKHILTDLGTLEIASITRDHLQHYLEQKAAQGHSFSLVDHLRWDLRAIFRLAVQDRLRGSNPAEMLFTPRTVSRPSRRILSPAHVQQILSVLGLREQLIVRLTLFSGMRPGEILALQWKHVADDHVEVVQRLYRGKLDRPKSERSARN